MHNIQDFAIVARVGLGLARGIAPSDGRVTSSPAQGRLICLEVGIQNQQHLLNPLYKPLLVILSPCYLPISQHCSPSPPPLRADSTPSAQYSILLYASNAKHARDGIPARSPCFSLLPASEFSSLSLLIKTFTTTLIRYLICLFFPLIIVGHPQKIPLKIL